jgi:exo-beta-1,3-glucanase (GH17 family)
MKKLIFFLCFVDLITGIAISSIYSRSASSMHLEDRKLSMEELRIKLESGKSFEREIPFIVRTFKPYLNGEWMGNAVSYGCYRKGQAPNRNGPSEAEILEDLNIITRYWHLIRVYNSDEDTERILTVIQKHNLPIKVMVGVWLENEEKNPELKKFNIANVLRGIELVNKYTNIVSAISVGNESQVFWSWHRMNTENLIRYIRAIRNNTTVPVTTADDYNFWNKPESKQVAAEIDFIVTHIYALWNGKTLEDAIEWMDHIYFQDVQKAHSDKLIVIGETGWATTYNPEKVGPGEQGTLIKGEVSIQAQEKFLIQLHEWVNEKKITTFLFEAFDEPWKGGGENSGPNEVEKHWGVFYENRTPKESFQNYLKHIQNKSD